MTLSYYADRVNLVHLLRRFPHWTVPQFAHAMQRSESWVKKWRKRLIPLLDQPAALQQALLGQSRTPKHPPARLDPEVEEAIVRIRDQPPEGLRRTPGPRAIQYYLQRDATLQALDLASSRSTRTIYQVLVKHQRIASRKEPEREPVERPEPMSQWQLDFTDISSLPVEPDGKRQHRAEACNVVDAGTSLILDAHVRADFTAETALQAVSQSFQTHGRPDGIRVDRDPRWVGSPQGSDFPSALLRFCACLGVEVAVCDPHHPQQNCFVERFHKTYQQECLWIDRPQTVQEARGARAPSSVRITTGNAPTRRSVVGISLRERLFLACPSCLRFLNRLIPTPGSSPGMGITSSARSMLLARSGSISNATGWANSGVDGA